jgi:protein-S-isoprenylcysteine O-methyltransferase Ste14
VIVAQALLLSNWIAGCAGLAGFGILFFGRVAREERMMLETFGVYGEDWPGLPVGTLK